MKRGNSSNWVHWLYAVVTGTLTSTDSVTVLTVYPFVWCPALLSYDLVVPVAVRAKPGGQRCLRVGVAGLPQPSALDLGVDLHPEQQRGVGEIEPDEKGDDGTEAAVGAVVR